MAAVVYSISSDSVDLGRAYTFTYQVPSLIQPLSSDIQSWLSSFLAGYVDIIKVDRGWFSEKYDIVIVPNYKATIGDIDASMQEALNAYMDQWTMTSGNPVTLVQVQKGDMVKSIAQTVGGVIGSIPGEIGTGLGEATVNFVQQVAPILLIGGAFFLVINNLSKKGGSA